MQDGLVQTHFQMEPRPAVRYIAVQAKLWVSLPALPVYVVCLMRQVKDIGVKLGPLTPAPSDWILGACRGCSSP